MAEFYVNDVIKLKFSLAGTDDDDREYNLPAGARGTILMLANDRYLVEFCEGIKTLAIITVTRDQIEPTLKAPDASLFHE